MTAIATDIQIRPDYPRKMTAMVVWGGAVYTTVLFLGSLGAPPDSWTILGAMVIQAAATAIESKVWQGTPDVLAVIVLIGDSLINAAGMWQPIKRLPDTPLWAMLMDLGAPEEVGMGALFALALAIGIILAYAPESIWGKRGKHV